MAEVEEVKLIEKENNDNVSNLDLFLILGDLFGVDSKINELKLELKLKDSNIEFIKFIINNFPSCLTEISSNLNLVLEDGKLDVSDVPILINMVKSIVNNFSKSIKKVKSVTVDELIDFIRNIIEILIHKDYIKVDNKEKVFKLIFVSVELLNTSVDAGQSVFDCVKKLFKC